MPKNLKPLLPAPENQEAARHVRSEIQLPKKPRMIRIACETCRTRKMRVSVFPLVLLVIQPCPSIFLSTCYPLPPMQSFIQVSYQMCCPQWVWGISISLTDNQHFTV